VSGLSFFLQPQSALISPPVGLDNQWFLFRKIQLHFLLARFFPLA
jgi:hypothetical protein